MIHQSTAPYETYDVGLVFAFQRVGSQRRMTELKRRSPGYRFRLTGSWLGTVVVQFNGDGYTGFVSCSLSSLACRC